MSTEEETAYLDNIARGVLIELGERLRTPFPEPDECAIRTAIRKSVVRAHEQGLLSASSRWTDNAELQAVLAKPSVKSALLEAGCWPIEIVSNIGAEIPDEWEEFFGDGEEVQ